MPTQIKLLVEGGVMAPGPALSQQIGPLGINMGQVISKINDATKSFKGLKVPVELNIDAAKNISIKVFSPSVSELLKQEVGVTVGSGLQKSNYIGNLAIEQIISVAKTKLPDMLCKSLEAAVKTVVGTCASLGILIESKSAIEIESLIANGKFNKEIQTEKVEVSAEKQKKLSDEFMVIKDEQDKKAKAAAAALAAATEAAEAAKATVAATPATTEVAATPEAKKAEPKKAEAKKK